MPSPATSAPANSDVLIDVPTRALGDTKIPYDILKYIPVESAEHYKLAPLGIEDGVLEVGMVDPEDIKGLDALNFIARASGMPFKIFKISQGDFDRITQMYGGLSGDVERAVTDFETEQKQAILEGEPSPLDLGGIAPKKGEKIIQEDAPTIKIVSTILRYAVDDRKSVV